MEFPKSKIGLMLAGFYLVIASAILIYGFICSGFLCGVVMAYPAIPWISLFGDASFSGVLGVVMLIASILLNAIIIYLITWLFRRKPVIGLICIAAIVILGSLFFIYYYSAH